MTHLTTDTSNDSGGGSNEELHLGGTLNMVPPPYTMMEEKENTSADLSPVDNLFPALVDCFGIILLGYLAGR